MRRWGTAGCSKGPELPIGTSPSIADKGGKRRPISTPLRRDRKGKIPHADCPAKRGSSFFSLETTSTDRRQLFVSALALTGRVSIAHTK